MAKPLSRSARSVTFETAVEVARRRKTSIARAEKDIHSGRLGPCGSIGGVVILFSSDVPEPFEIFRQLMATRYGRT